METRSHRKFLLRKFFDEYMDLNRSKEDEQVTVDSIRNGVEFKGTNLWILIFATFIASLGLNVNSTAVIIGAMLISPLMGPIMGVGLAIGQNDFELMKRSLKSFMVATLFSVVTATLYFLFTPLDEVQSELLARTSPTIYDVFIALFGGLAGIVALATKEKGNVIPGVARFRTGYGESAVFPGGLLPVFHQFRIYQPGYLPGSPFHALQTETVCR